MSGSQQQPARLLLLGRRRAVVEQRDQPAGLELGVVLPVEARAGAELEAAVRAAEAPADGAAADVDVVQRPGVARGEQHVARAEPGIDGVDVDVVPRVVVCGAGL